MERESYSSFLANFRRRAADSQARSSQKIPTPPPISPLLYPQDDAEDEVFDVPEDPGIGDRHYAQFEHGPPIIRQFDGADSDTPSITELTSSLDSMDSRQQLSVVDAPRLVHNRDGPGSGSPPRIYHREPDTIRSSVVMDCTPKPKPPKSKGGPRKRGATAVSKSTGQPDSEDVPAPSKPKRPKAAPARSYCFTLNNPVDLPDLDDPLIDYAVYSEEQGEEGVDHLQGYLKLTRPVRFTYLKNHWKFGLESAHFEKVRGTPDQARNYCMPHKKLADKTAVDPTHIAGPYEFGTFRSQGARTDWEGLKTDILSGKPKSELIADHFRLALCYPRGLEQAIEALRPPKPRNEKTFVTLLYGPPGTGKSHYCQEASPDAYWKQRDNSNNQWFSGWDGKADIVFDDFYGWISYDLMLRVMDKWKLLVEGKGSTINFAAKRIYITTNTTPETWWKKAPFNEEAFWRRIDRVLVFPDKTRKGYHETYLGEEQIQSFRDHYCNQDLAGVPAGYDPAK